MASFPCRLGAWGAGDTASDQQSCVFHPIFLSFGLIGLFLLTPCGEHSWLELGTAVLLLQVGLVCRGTAAVPAKLSDSETFEDAPTVAGENENWK